MAWESARESARRQREKAERLQRSADPRERGTDGERATAAALETLPPESWTVFHDVRWPGRKHANVDHVAVGPGGVFVIDSMDWSGRIGVRDNVLRHNGRPRESTVAGAVEAALAVSRMTPVVSPQHVLPVLCFVRDEPFTGWARAVLVCSTANVVDFLVTRPEVLAPHAVSEACLHLDASFRSAAVPELRGGAAPARRSRRKAPRALLRVLVGLAFLGLLFVSPQVVTSVSDGIAGLITTQVVEDQAPTTQPSEKPRRER